MFAAGLLVPWHSAGELIHQSRNMAPHMADKLHLCPQQPNGLHTRCEPGSAALPQDKSLSSGEYNRGSG